MHHDEFNDDDKTRADGFERDVTPRLVHLDDTRDLQVADGDPDIRGWDVRTADGEKIGKVKDLVVDTTLMKVRYFEAVIDKDVLNASDDRHVLIPIGSARLDDDDDDVFLSSAIVDPRTLRPYDRNSLSREYELSVRDQYPTATAWDDRSTTGTERATNFADRAPLADGGRSGDEDFYGSDLYDESRFFGARRRGREEANYIGPIDESVRRNEDR